MSYLIKRTVIAAARFEVDAIVDANEIGDETQIARLVSLGAVEEVADAAPELPEMDEALRVAMIEAINGLPKDAFDNGGKPKVKALEAALPAHKDRITAAARDLIWAEMKAAADAAT
ncbi:hypothetical protein [uncultured Roseovarius sp.]|uniref:hypothetical protein n=1 Tax=uncultured Roseovarius sp. TaxID=293344 RepID=UPI002606C97E|nr:hypothetical protein [uncultured Roseovarius sp.]